MTRADDCLSDEALAAWEDAAAQAGDAATMLIAGIAMGEPAHGLASMTAEEIESAWPTLTDSTSGEEIVALLQDPRRARQIADSWGDPWPDDAGAAGGAS